MNDDGERASRWFPINREVSLDPAAPDPILTLSIATTRPRKGAPGERVCIWDDCVLDAGHEGECEVRVPVYGSQP